MRLRSTDHQAHPWRIHDLASEFKVEDVWGLETHGGANDFGRLVALFLSSFDHAPTGPVRVLWATRWKLGEWLRWDKPEAGLGRRVGSLRSRLPADMREGPAGADPSCLPFVHLYRLENEWAAEIANTTMHGVLHIGWVPVGPDSYQGQMAVLVKPNGLLGWAYLAAIKPFRHLIYPRWIRRIEREWVS